MTKIFSIANQKGGVGKTTTAINLSCALTRKKLRVLLIDLDPQANATSALGLPKIDGGSLLNPLLEGESLKPKILSSSVKNLDVIPAETDLATIEFELRDKKDYLFRLQKILMPIKEEGIYDAIILDCPPALGLLTMNSLTASDFLLVTLQCEYLALEGLSQILGVVDQIRDAAVNPDLTIGGIIMTMYDSRTNLSQQVVSDITENFPEQIFKSIIPRSIRLGEAPSHGKSIFDYEPTSSAAAAYEALGKEIIKRFDLKQS